VVVVIAVEFKLLVVVDDVAVLFSSPTRDWIRQVDLILL